MLSRYRDTPTGAVLNALGLLLFGLAMLAVGLDHMWTGAPGADDSLLVIQIPLLLTICAVTIVKDRWPIGTLVAGLPILGADYWFGAQLGITLAFIDLIYGAARKASPVAVRWLGGIVAGLVFLAFAVAFVIDGNLRFSVFAGLQVVAAVVTPYWWGLSVRRAEENAALAGARAADLKRIAELREQEVVRDERTRMARELHDSLSGDLSAIAIHAEAALATPADETGTDRQALRSIRASSVSAMEEIRSMVLLLRSGQRDLTSAPRLEDLGALLDDLRGRVDVHLTTNGDHALPAATSQAAYRIVQEALTNAGKHAPGQRVELQISRDRGEIVIHACNPMSRTTRDAPGTGLGLTTMRERAEALGGSFAAGPDDSTWTVRAMLPARVAS